MQGPPFGWPDAVLLDGEPYNYENDTKKILTSLAFSSQAASTQDWITVVAYPMQHDSQQKLAARIWDSSDHLTGLGLLNLAHQISEKALGIPLIAAGTLASSAVAGWFPLSTWRASHGDTNPEPKLETILASVYASLLDGCGEPKDVDKLNRRIFGTTRPW